MDKFCQYCENLLYENYYNNKLTFKCHACMVNYPSTDDDTMRYDFVNKTNISIYDNILNNAQRDPATIKAYDKCPKCGHNIVKQVRIGEDMYLINICEKCNNKYLYNSTSTQTTL